MELHQLRYFVAVAEAGSFSNAARRCHVAQPSLSQQIKKLEIDLGQELFERHPSGVVLTEAGHALLPRARRVLSEVQEAAAALRSDIDDGAGPLAVGAIPTMAPYVLPPVLAPFSQRFPRCELTVREDLTDRLIEALLAYELDVAVLSTPIEEELVDVEVLGSERLLLAAPPGYPLPADHDVSLGALEHEPTIVVHEMHCLGQQIRSFCDAARVRQRVVCRSTQLATVQELVALGLGISILPEMAIAQDKDGRCCYHSLSEPQPCRDIAVAWRV
ncbi:MAG: LysR family transcriptional regulator, partial [Acidobacteria bacterium]|nr:LysR family transcriptional regulator [Acidobacteriota bacterium]